VAHGRANVGEERFAVAAQAGAVLTAAPGRTEFRPDIEGMRAVAVLAVLLYHGRIGPFQGGYVGVDVFFVVSGFLITSLLLRESRTTGTIDLPRFWGRRIRRLMPASCLVIVATVLASRFMLDPLTQTKVAWDGLLASLGIVINTVFAFRDVDYLNADINPFQHYWSLALEETFYLIWPIVVLYAMRGARHGRRLFAIVAVAAPISLLLCILLTRRNQPVAFFLLPTRAWELLAGAMLALLAQSRVRLNQDGVAVMGWIGLAGVALVTVKFSTTTMFPGAAATLPVAATLAMLAAGGAPNGPRLVLDTAPMQWIGARSYAIYLWHWPLLTLPEMKYGSVSTPWRVILLLASVGLAALSYRILENPVRHHPWLAARSTRSLAVGAGIIASAAVLTAALYVAKPDLAGGDAVAATTTPTSDHSVTPESDSQAPSTDPADSADPANPADQASVTDSTVPASAIPAQGLTIADGVAVEVVPADLTPSLRKASADLPAIYDDGCLLDVGTTALKDCVYGDPSSGVTIALFGDSHAAHWFPALERVAGDRGWKLVVLAKRGCATAEFPTYDNNNRERKECGPWREQVAARLAELQPSVLVISTYRYRLVNDNPKQKDVDTWRSGLDQTLGAVKDTARAVLFLSDTPNPIDDIPSCLAGHLKSVDKCTRSRADGEKRTIVDIERTVAQRNGIEFVATADWLCADGTCPVIVGNLLLYRDDNHLTATAAKWLAPQLDAELVRLAG
jgi:peptidoglycan/LPS O-acetylase OafA/YrhL